MAIIPADFLDRGSKFLTAEPDNDCADLVRLFLRQRQDWFCISRVNPPNDGCRPPGRLSIIGGGAVLGNDARCRGGWHRATQTRSCAALAWVTINRFVTGPGSKRA
ncbi:hypothetical protein GCM10019059_41230 [Camelimonas fluminis]|nr:hypothetical protein GCM10019059_41230 [Camelimonas fluminis]